MLSESEASKYAVPVIEEYDERDETMDVSALIPGKKAIRINGAKVLTSAGKHRQDQGRCSQSCSVEVPDSSGLVRFFSQCMHFIIFVIYYGCSVEPGTQIGLHMADEILLYWNREKNEEELYYSQYSNLCNQRACMPRIRF
jgi:hypothetical protein